MKIAWKIENLNYRKSDGYVTTANVKVYVDDEIGNDFITLACSWPNGELQTPYAQLTDSQIMDWVLQSVDKEAVEASLISQLTKVPTLNVGLPWA
jgi:hypothetical protein